MGVALGKGLVVCLSARFGMLMAQVLEGPEFQGLGLGQASDFLPDIVVLGQGILRDLGVLVLRFLLGLGVVLGCFLGLRPRC